MTAYLEPSGDRLLIIDGCTSPADVERVVAACRDIKGVVIIGVDVAHELDQTGIAVMKRGAEHIELIEYRELCQAPVAVLDKVDTPRPTESRRRKVWEGMKRIAGADIRRFLPRRT